MILYNEDLFFVYIKFIVVWIDFVYFIVILFGICGFILIREEIDGRGM